MEAIILAGGLGTRLRTVVNDIPKPMALIEGRPFLSYILEHLNNHSYKKVILATGYKHECIEEYFGNQYKNMDLLYSIESEPLGTGGALQKAFKLVTSHQVTVLNGDTLFLINLNQLLAFHLFSSSDATLAIKPMRDFDRYGRVVIDSDKRVIVFEEKKKYKSGYINGGIYVLNKNIFDEIDNPRNFSFERDFLQKHVNELNFTASICDNYFIDIGIPDDYRKAQREINRYF